VVNPPGEFASRVFLATVSPPNPGPGGARSATGLDILVNYVPRARHGADPGPEGAAPIPVPEGTAENSPTFQRRFNVGW